MGLCLVHCMKNLEVPVSNSVACSKVDSDFNPSEGGFGKSKLSAPNVAMGKVNLFHRKKVTIKCYF